MKKYLLSILFYTSFITIAAAQIPKLDSSFGTNGFTQTDISKYNDAAQVIELQPDGKILLGGHIGHKSGSLGMAIVRYTANGVLDTSFSNDGIDTFIIGDINSFNTLDMIVAIKVQTDGKIVAAARTNDYDANFQVISRVVLVRYNVNGTRDNSFGSNGMVFGDVQNSQPSAIALQQDGKIVLAGTRTVRQTAQPQMYIEMIVSRFNTDGSVDYSFGNNGTTIINPDSDKRISFRPNTVRIQSDGKILTYAIYWDAGKQIGKSGIIRCNTDGSADNTFGNGGFIIPHYYNSHTSTHQMALQKNGKIVVTGYTNVTPEYVTKLVLARYTSNGTSDPAFGKNGITYFHFDTTIMESAKANVIALQKDEKIIVLGVGYRDSISGTFLVRFGIDGKLDSSFGTNGMMFYNMTSPENSVVPGGDMTIQPDDKLLINAYISGQTLSYFGIIRMITTLNTGIIDTKAGTNNLLFYPNPVANISTLKYELLNNENVTITIFDMTGKIVNNPVKNKMRTAGQHTESIDFSSFVSGSYILTIQTSKGNTNIKIIK
ncbi:MAG: T9SS type A sorting domain-containing protein [Bacteroidia bacterium]